MILKRRFFLLAAPAIVAAPSLMRVSVMPRELRSSGNILGDAGSWFVSWGWIPKEDTAFVEGMSQTVAETIWYGIPRLEGAQLERLKRRAVERGWRSI